MPDPTPARRVFRPGPTWRSLRRVCQLFALFAIVVAPVLGGWQRLDRNMLAAWHGEGWDLPGPLLHALPLGSAPRAAYDNNVLLGGGTAVDYLSIPVADPVGATVSLLASVELSTVVVVAWLLPLLLALLGGRVFCGWFCPFGTLARGLEGLLERLPWRPTPFKPPRARVGRYLILAVAVVLAAVGAQSLLYLLLPHMLVQQAGYAVWLMGGGGAALGALLGLLAVGVVFGPTIYCTVVCPTGAALAIPGRRRVVRLALVDRARCGAHCDLCDRACWLWLQPSTGDPGADCDNCARCTQVCPSANLQFVARGPWRPRTFVAVLGLLFALVWPGSADAARPVQGHKPRLLLEARHELAGTDVQVSVVDKQDVLLDADDPTAEKKTEISVYLAKGDRGQRDERGRLPEREIYRGPLTIHLTGRGGLDVEAAFEHPNYPWSTPNRTIYRGRFDAELEPGDRIEFGPIQGWLPTPAVVVIPEPNAGAPANRVAWFGFVAFLLLGGLTALSLALRRNEGPA